MNLKQMMTHPEEYFDWPENIVKTSMLTTAEKESLLIAWKNELQLKIDATTEGMRVRTQNDDINTLAKINNLLEIIKTKSS